MFTKKTATRLSLSLAVVLVIAIPALAQETAWDDYVRRNPAAVDDDSLDPLMRRMLNVMRPDQATALFDGAAPEEIVLEDGQTLASYLLDSVGGGPGLVYVPRDQCLVFRTFAQTAPVTGAMAADEVREYFARGSGTPHTDQGGVGGCLIPDEAVAVVMHLRVVAVGGGGGNGFLKAWRADLPEPSTNLLDFEMTVGRYATAAVIELCPLGSCATGEFKVKTVALGGQVRGDVVGYFRAIEAADVPGAGDADTLDGLDSTDFALAIHTHDGGDITSGTVGEPFIDPLITRDDEVVDIVKANDGSGSGIDADLLDGVDSLDLMLQVGNCLTVSPSCPAGAAEALAARCWTSITAALGEIGAGLAAASPTNRYVIKVGPGIYTDQVTMLANVDIDGSGQKLTVITNTATPTLAGANDAALTSLTVENTDGGSAIQASGVSPMIKHVTARATGAGTPKAVEIGMGAAPMLTHVTTQSDGDGMTSTAATATIRDSILNGTTTGIVNAGGATTDIVNTQITGGASDGGTGASFSCVGAYDGSFTALDANCQ